MPILYLGIFFIPFFILVFFLLFKRLELSLGREFGLTVVLRSQDEKIVNFLVYFKNFLMSCKGRVSFFVLNGLVYPLHRFSRRTKFKISSAYFRFLERLRQRHMARYNKNESSLYLKTVSSNGGNEDKDNEVESEETKKS